MFSISLSSNPHSGPITKKSILEKSTFLKSFPSKFTIALFQLISLKLLITFISGIYQLILCSEASSAIFSNLSSLLSFIFLKTPLLVHIK